MDYSISMAIVDYIPVAVFLAGALILQKDLYNKMSPSAFALFAAGTIDVFGAGALKATYKLLYAAGVCNFEALSSLFFPLQAIGFMLSGAGILTMLLKKKKKVLAAAAPAFFSGTVIFIVMMVAGVGALDFGLAVLAGKMKKKGTVFLFIAAFVLCLAMGYLSSKDFSEAYMNWAAEIVNSGAQIAFMLGAISLHRAGLKEWILASA